MNAIEDFRAAMRAVGLDYAGPVLADGKLHRFKAGGDHDRNSWFVLRAGPPATGTYGCWKRGFTENWCERNGQLSQIELDRVREQWKQAERERERMETERHARAQKVADWIFKHAQPVTTHAYLKAKSVLPHGDIRACRGALLVPLRDAGGELHSLQFIGADASPVVSTPSPAKPPARWCCAKDTPPARASMKRLGSGWSVRCTPET